jgi:hypothetical protein
MESAMATSSSALAAPAAPDAAGTVDTDNVQAGDQTTPDTVTATETSVANETQSEATSESSAEQPGDQNPPGANVDHQFEGVE